MELALVIRELWSRRRIVSVGVALGAIVAVLSVSQISGFSLKGKSETYSSASTQLFVDTPSTALGNVTQDVTQLQARATVLANFMASPTIVDLIGKRVGLSGNQIYAAGPVNPNQPRSVIEPTELKRNLQVTGESKPYRLEFLNDPTLPTIGINTQAPTTKMATALADASVAALQAYVTELETIGHTPKRSRVVIRQLGEANGGVVDPGASTKLAALVFVAVFVLWCILVLVGARFARSWKTSRSVYEQLAAGIAPSPASNNGHKTMQRVNGHAPLDRARDVDFGSSSNVWIPPDSGRAPKPNGATRSDRHDRSDREFVGSAFRSDRSDRAHRD